jgi:hypothetical protein
MWNVGRMVMGAVVAMTCLVGGAVWRVSAGDDVSYETPPLEGLVLDRVLDSIKVHENKRGDSVRISVKGRILVGGRNPRPGIALNRDSVLVVRVNGQVVERRFVGPFGPIHDEDEACCYGLPPMGCTDVSCDEDGCSGHLGSCLCSCDGGGTTGEGPSDYTADLGPFLVQSGDHIHVSIGPAPGATPELFTLNDSQWAPVGVNAGGKCRRRDARK